MFSAASFFVLFCVTASCVYAENLENRSNRLKRQSNPTNIACVPKNTCINREAAELSNSNCPAGQELCIRSNPGLSCGIRYVDFTDNLDGPSEFAAFPWLVYIRNQTGYTGAGVLIDDRHVLTAAHKVNLNAKSLGNLQIYLGVHDPADMSPATRAGVSKIEIHPNFDDRTLLHDIAILQLDKPVELGYQKNIARACLPTPGHFYTGQSCYISGWGKSSFESNDAPTKQKQVTLPVVSFLRCNTSMSHLLGSHVNQFLNERSHICAGGVRGKDVCTQDGGAPLVCRNENNVYTVVGLAIWGKNCGQQDVYGVYVNVSNYRDWIISTQTKLYG